MKSLFLNLFVVVQVLFVMQASGADGASEKVGIDVGLGFHSNYGLIGIGSRYFISENLDAHIATGVDMTGTAVGLGSRYYFSYEDTCWFIFNCDSKVFIGGTILKTSGGKITSESDGRKADYKISDGTAGNLVIGTYHIYKSGFTMGLEIGYRKWMERPETTFVSGTFLNDDKDTLDKWTDDALNIAFTFGWLF